MRRSAGFAALGAVALALAGCASVPQAPEPLPSNFVPAISASIDPVSDSIGGFTALEREALRVRVRTCKGYGTGSAFAISENQAVSNRHVVEGATDITVTTYDGKTHDVTKWVVLDDGDLALLTIEDEFSDVATIADAEPVNAENLTIAGYPNGSKLAVTEGPYIRAVPDDLDDATDPVYMIAAETHPGSSGSAVANDDGDVVGVVYASDDVSTSYAVSLPTLKDFLADPSQGHSSKGKCEAQN